MPRPRTRHPSRARRPRFGGALVAGAVASLALSGCGDTAASSDSGIQVATAAYPLSFAADRILGDSGDVVDLVPPGSDPHDLELTPQQIAEVIEAELVLYGEGFQPAVDEAVEQNAEGTVLNVVSIVENFASLSGHADEEGDSHEGEESHGDDEVHGEETHSGEGEDEHGHSLENDPHVWLDPLSFAAVVDATAAALSRIDAEGAEGYRERAASLREELEVLDEEFASGLANCERRTFVTTHAAFGYLADRYDLEMVAISGLTPDAEPSAQRIAEISDQIEAEGVTTVFVERLTSPNLADTLATDVGVDTAVLDPIEGLTDETEDADYFSLMRDNLSALQEANGCS